MKWYWRGQLECVSKPQHTLFFPFFSLGVSGWAAHSLHRSTKYSYICYSKKWMGCKPVTYNQEKEDSKLNLSSLAQELIWCALNYPLRSLQRKATAKPLVNLMPGTTVRQHVSILVSPEGSGALVKCSLEESTTCIPPLHDTVHWGQFWLQWY